MASTESGAAAPGFPGRAASLAVTLRSPRARPSALAALGLAVLGVVAFGPYVRHGGFTYDDWEIVSFGHFRGFSGVFNLLWDLDGRRPLAGVYYGIVTAILGLHQHWYLALGAALQVTLAWMVWLVLRELRAGYVTAGSVAALVLLYPFSDSTWLWSTADLLDMCLILWLLGLLIALRALRSPRRGWAWHVVATALYASSVLMYENTLVVIVLSGAVYLVRAPRRLALQRWAADIGVVAIVVLLFTSQLIDLGGGRDTHTIKGLGYALHHAAMIADQGLALGAVSLVPFGAPDRWLVLGIAAALAATAGLIMRRTPDLSLERNLRWLLALGGAGLLVAVAGWAMLSVADDFYSPAAVGVGNRINALARLGIVAAVVASAQIAATLVLSRRPRIRQQFTPWLAVVLVAVVGAGYLGKLGADRGAWMRASSARNAVLQRLRGEVAHLPAGSTLIAGGFAFYAAPGVPVFAADWDLNGAAELLLNDSSLQAWPESPGALKCRPSGVGVTGISAGQVAPYGRTVFVNVATGATTRIDSVTACQKLAQSA